MSALPGPLIEAVANHLRGGEPSDGSDLDCAVDQSARELLAVAMDESLGWDRLVIADDAFAGLQNQLSRVWALFRATKACAEAQEKTLAEVRAQRDEWEQIATGYRRDLSHETAVRICDWLDGRTGYNGGGFTSADDVARAIRDHFCTPEKTA